MTDTKLAILLILVLLTLAPIVASRRTRAQSQNRGSRVRIARPALTTKST